MIFNVLLLYRHGSRHTIVSREAKKSQRRELFTRNIAKKLINALAKPPWQLAPSYHGPNTFLLHMIEPTNQQRWKSAPPFLSTGHCEFNGARSCTHVWKAIALESISPMMKRFRLSLFSNSLLHSHLLGHLVWSARRFYLCLFVCFFQFLSHTFFASIKVCMSPRDTNFT